MIIFKKCVYPIELPFYRQGAMILESFDFLVSSSTYTSKKEQLPKLLDMVLILELSLENKT